MEGIDKGSPWGVGVAQEKGKLLLLKMVDSGKSVASIPLI